MDQEEEHSADSEVDVESSLQADSGGNLEQIRDSETVDLIREIVALKLAIYHGDISSTDSIDRLTKLGVRLERRKLNTSAKILKVLDLIESREKDFLQGIRFTPHLKSRGYVDSVFFPKNEVWEVLTESEAIIKEDLEFSDLEDNRMDVPKYLHVPSLVKELGVVFTHALVVADRHTIERQSTVLDRETPVGVMGKIVMALEPEISTTTVGALSSGQTFLSDGGLIIGDGIVKFAHTKDIGTQPRGRERVVSGASTQYGRVSSDLDKKSVLRAILHPEGWNEMVVKNPKVAGVFVSEQLVNWVEQGIGIDQLMEYLELAKDMSVPAYCFNSSTRQFHKIESFKDGKLYMEEEPTKSETMLAHTKHLAESDRVDEVKRILNNAPFKLRLRDKYFYDHWKLARDEYKKLKKLKDTDFFRVGDMVFGGYGEKFGGIEGCISQIVKKGDLLEKNIDSVQNLEEKERCRVDISVFGFILRAIADAAELDGDSDMSTLANVSAEKFVSQNQYDEFYKQRINPKTGGFKMTSEELELIYADAK